MLAEREQLRDINKQPSPHGAMAASKKKDEDKEASLDEQIAEDPYVTEGVALLLDLLG